ncbi:hypothetical protein KIF24_30795 [Micromonospora sp. Llam7]|nr:hypothetical protein [Micromonospora tarapacensis]
MRDPDLPGSGPTLWSRTPTGVPGGSPTGPRTRIPPREDDAVRRSLELENECADTLAHDGYRVHQNPTRREIADARQSTGDVGKPDKEPDYLIEGHVFDCYAPTPGKAVRGVWTEVAEKVARQQTQRVVLNLQDWRGDIAALQKQFDDWPVPHLKELAAVTRSGAIIQIVRRD